MAMRNRIKELRYVRAGDLAPDERNWRLHPESQTSAVRAMLDRVGWADALIARESEAGLVLVDGHLRAGLDADAKVPVLVTDLSEDEAGEVLATLDPLAAMAEIDGPALDDLLNTIDMGLDTDFANVLGDVRAFADLGPMPDFQPVSVSDQPRLDQKKQVECPACGHTFEPA